MVRLWFGSFCAAYLVVGAGCSFDTAGLSSGVDAQQPVAADAGHHDATVPGDASAGDAATDASSEECADGERALPFEAANLGRCIVEPVEVLDVPSGARWRLNTDTRVLDNIDIGISPPPISAYEILAPAEGPELLVVSATSISLGQGATLEVRGERALALVSFSALTIGADAILDASAVGTQSGPGADLAVCGVHAGRGDAGGPQAFEGEEGGAGGGGGGYGAKGGTGAAVNANDAGAGPTPGGEPAAESATLAPLRAGCPGGEGYQISGTGPADAGAGGGAGGAVQLVAADSLTIAGAATVSGGGGRAGREHSGGGGGGAGGALLLEGQAIHVSGALTANGGGGGEGMRRQGKNLCAEPSPGEDGAVASAEPAAGGSSPPGTDGPLNCNTSGAGGAGGAREALDGQPGAEGDSSAGDGFPAGGGGGGGAVGRIRVAACAEPSFDSVVISPPAVVGEATACP